MSEAEAQAEKPRREAEMEAVKVEVSVILGRTILPMHQLLRMGRGAVILLDTSADDQVWVLANNHPIARAEVVVQNDRIAVSISDTANVYDYWAQDT